MAGEQQTAEHCAEGNEETGRPTYKGRSHRGILPDLHNTGRNMCRTTSNRKGRRTTGSLTVSSWKGSASPSSPKRNLKRYRICWRSGMRNHGTTRRTRAPTRTTSGAGSCAASAATLSQRPGGAPSQGTSPPTPTSAMTRPGRAPFRQGLRTA